MLEDDLIIGCLEDLRNDIDDIQNNLIKDEHNSYEYYRKLHKDIQDEVYASLFFNNYLTELQNEELLQLYRNNNFEINNDVEIENFNYLNHDKCVANLDGLKNIISIIQKELNMNPNKSYELYKKLYFFIQGEIFANLYFNKSLTKQQYDELITLFGIDNLIGKMHLFSKNDIKLVKVLK